MKAPTRASMKVAAIGWNVLPSTPSRFGAALAQHQQGRFDHDYRAVHQDAEVQCTQAHQVAADAEAVHADHREQERQRNHQRGDRRRTQVAQQQEQHHHHQ
ncbi:hypothetical protein G6F31_020599 [Rhizopus arrhizus]|nr:hypothetical protein G6F31_020599 [Rhizopus arrhizus]